MKNFTRPLLRPSLLIILFCSCNLNKIDDSGGSSGDLPEFELHFPFESGKTVTISSVVEALDGGYIVSGTASNANFTFSNLFVLKTNASGVVSKVQSNFGNFSTVTGGNLVKGSDAYYIVGTEDDNDSQIIVAKIKPDLTIGWTKEIGRADQFEVGQSLALTASGDIIVAGAKSNGASSYDPFFLKMGASSGAIIDSTTINISNNGSFFPKSIVRNGNSFGIMGYNFGISLPFAFFMRIDEQLNALINYKSQPDLGNGAGSIVAGIGDGYVIMNGVSAQLERQAYITSINGNGDQVARFDQFVTIPETGFLGGSTANGKLIPCGWASQVLGTDQHGIAALVSASLSTEATYEYNQAGILCELTASNGVSDGGYILAGAYDNGKEILLVKLNDQFK